MRVPSAIPSVRDLSIFEHMHNSAYTRVAHSGTIPAGVPMTTSREDLDLKQEVGKRLAQARRALGWTQLELGLKTGMAKTTIASYEQGTRLPGPTEATLLGDALGVSPAYLLVVDGDDMHLLDAEAEMVRLMRALPPEEQAKIKKLLEGRARLFAQQATTKKRPPPK
jgi:transcriptional regulator with XRE-family HTH domain